MPETTKSKTVSSFSLSQMSWWWIVPLIACVDVLLKLLFLRLGIGHINVGISYGLLSGHFNWLAIAILQASVLVFLIYFSRKYCINKIETFGVSLIVAGGLGNLLSRLVWHGVLDYIQIWVLPTFNLADISVCIGVAVIISAKINKYWK